MPTAHASGLSRAVPADKASILAIEAPRSSMAQLLALGFSRAPSSAARGRFTSRTIATKFEKEGQHRAQLRNYYTRCTHQALLRISRRQGLGNSAAPLQSSLRNELIVQVGVHRLGSAFRSVTGVLYSPKRHL